MKIWEIDWVEGKIYRDNKAGEEWITYKKMNGMSLKDRYGTDIVELCSLYDMSKLELEEVIDWKKVKVNTPVLVRNSENNSWILRHFDSCEVSPSGKSAIYRVFKGGRTSFTIQQVNQGEQKYEYYSQIKLYKEEK